MPLSAWFVTALGVGALLAVLFALCALFMPDKAAIKQAADKYN